MTEILTESFCERCGTRYTFESSAPRARRLGKFKTLSKGLKNFVLSDDSTLDEAMAAARSDEERDVTSQQLDAFHKTFNFCMSCRQYTCANCWNEVDGRCLSCAPHLGNDVLAAPFPEIRPVAHPHVSSNGHSAHDEDVLSQVEASWPASDVAAGPAGGDVPGAQPTEPTVGAEIVAPSARRLASIDPQASPPGPLDAEATFPLETPVLETPAEGGPERTVTAAPAVAAEAVAEPSAAAEPGQGSSTQTEAPAEDATALESAPQLDTDRVAAVAARRTDAFLRRFRPGQSLDAAIAAFEAGLADAETMSEAPAPPPAAAGAADDARVEQPEAAAQSAALLAVEPPPGPALESLPVPEPPAATPEPGATAEVAPEPVSVAGPEPAAIDALPEPEAVTAPVSELEPEPAAANVGTPATEESPVAADTRDDRVEIPTWRIVAPEEADTGRSTPPVAAPGPTRRPEPTQWPATPEWPTQPEADPLSFLTARRATDAMWAASSQDLLRVPPRPGVTASTPTVQSCVSCGLSLSATARFCRRCGARQEA